MALSIGEPILLSNSGCHRTDKDPLMPSHCHNLVEAWSFEMISTYRPWESSVLQLTDIKFRRWQMHAVRSR